MAALKTADALTAIPWAQFEKVVVLSPHLDDAALSCAGLLAAVHDKTRIVVATVSCANPSKREDNDATAGSGRARRGFTPPQERRKEDMRAMRALGCNFVHLGFADCVDRRSATSGELIYRQERVRWQRPSLEDSAHMEELFIVLKRLCGRMGQVLVVCPLGIGFHVDHLICAQVVLRLMRTGANVLFYEDFPYVANPMRRDGFADSPNAAMERLGVEPIERLVLSYDPQKKEEILMLYESQVPKLFGSRDGLRASLQSLHYESRPVEFYWRVRIAAAPPASGVQ